MNEKQLLDCLDALIEMKEVCQEEGEDDLVDSEIARLLQLIK